MPLIPPDLDNRCGFILHLPANHPFNAACINMHDPAFTEHHEGFPGRTRAVLDWALLTSWIGTAFDNNSPVLLAQALLLWPLAKIFGAPLWAWGSPTNNTDSQ